MGVTEKRGEETKILKRRGKFGSRGGRLKKEGRGPGVLLRTKADLRKMVYKIFPNFVLKYTVHFWVELKKIANSD